MTGSEDTFKESINLQYPSATLNDREIATILGLHKETIYRMRKLGKGPAFVKIGKKVLCMKQDFFEWFFSNYSKNSADGIE